MLQKGNEIAIRSQSTEMSTRPSAQLSIKGEPVKSIPSIDTDTPMPQGRWKVVSSVNPTQDLSAYHKQIKDIPTGCLLDLEI